jgi:flagellar biosynthesis/type III secretory pathway chaperone
MPANIHHPIALSLEREIETIRRLLEHLRAEHAALNGNDPDRITEILQGKGRILAELDAIDKERDRLMREAGFDPRDGEDSAALTGIGPVHRREIMRSWRRLLELGEQCLQQNTINGALIQSGLRQAQQILAVLRGRQPDEHPSYGPGPKPGAGEAAASRALGKA